MRKMFVMMLVFLLLAATSPFSNGYKKGYKDGYCHQVYACIAPIPPIAPTPRIDEVSYEDGYKRGFLDGRDQRLSEQ